MPRFEAAVRAVRAAAVERAVRAAAVKRGGAAGSKLGTGGSRAPLPVAQPRGCPATPRPSRGRARRARHGLEAQNRGDAMRDQCAADVGAFFRCVLGKGEGEGSP